MNSKGADQSAQKHRLVMVFVVRKPQKQVYSRRGPYVGFVKMLELAKE